MAARLSTFFEGGAQNSPTDTPLMEEDSSPSLASGILSRSDSKTQTQYLTIVPRPTNSISN
jgi:hypothetical protein